MERNPCQNIPYLYEKLVIDKDTFFLHHGAMEPCLHVFLGVLWITTQRAGVSMSQNANESLIKTCIIVTDYTVFTNGKICLAGVNNAGKTFRILPYLTHDKYHRQDIFLASKLFILGKFMTPENPHIEDFYLVKLLKILETRDIPAFRKVLERTSVKDITVYFGDIGDDRSIPDAADAACSLVTVRVNPKDIEAVEDFRNHKIRLNFTLATGQSYEKVSLRQHNHLWGLTDTNVHERVALINTRIAQSETIYLRLGITRPASGMHWLQANGIYFFGESD